MVEVGWSAERGTEGPYIRKAYGGVPEWLKGADCKSAGEAYVGSNPTPTIFRG